MQHIKVKTSEEIPSIVNVWKLRWKTSSSEAPVSVIKT